jgi:hypothetical protein
MPRHPHVAALIAAFSLLAQSSSILQAQAPQDGPRISVLADMRTSIIRAIGAEDQTVELEVGGDILTVLRINSNMNQATHAGRDNEATAIVAIVSKAISGRAEFGNLITVRVQYSMRSGGDSNVIDTVEFRKDPSGLFQYHQT